MTTNLTDKYRPRRLSQMVGQSTAINVAKGMIDKGVPPTVLLTGPRSSGKTTLARILAYRLNCQDPKGCEPCGKCQSCKLRPRHPDILEINAADERGIGTIRRLQSISVLAPRFEKRVVIMDECHALTPQAYQAALKLFEEPPKTCTFFLVTTNPEKMPETILSRCSPVGLRIISEKVLAKWLVDIAKKEDFDLELKASQMLAEASSGHPREALTFLQQVMSHPEIDADDFPLGVLGVVRQVTHTASTKLIIDFVTAAVDGDMAQCFKAYGSIDDPVVFLTGVVETLQALVRLLIDPRLVSSRFSSLLKPLRSAKLEDVAQCLEAFAGSLQQAKTYVMPPDVVLDLAILKASE